MNREMLRMKTMKDEINHRKSFKNLMKMVRAEDAMVDHRIEVMENGEKFVIAFNCYIDENESSETFGESTGISVYAIPIKKLKSNNLTLSDCPRALFSYMPSYCGTFALKNIEEYLEKNFKNYNATDLYCYELDCIDVEEFQSIGVGSLLLDVAIDEFERENIDRINDCTGEIITHIHAEMIPTDDDRLDDLIRFYEKSGFDCSGRLFISRLID